MDEYLKYSSRMVNTAVWTENRKDLTYTGVAVCKKEAYKVYMS